MHASYASSEGSCLQRRTLAETFTTPLHNGLWPVQGRNQDCRAPLHALTPPGVESASLKEPCGAYPHKCLFIYSSEAARILISALGP
jgi:hypothetical protein